MDQEFDFGDLDAIFERLEQLSAEVQSRIAMRASQQTDEQSAFGQRAKRGELGREWQILWSRVDLKQTSVQAIMGGQDTSPEARVVRERSQQGISRLGEEAAEDERTGTVKLSPRTRMSQMSAELNKRIAEAREAAEEGAS